MKTAKEVCEEQLEKNVNYIINNIIINGGIEWLDYKLNNNVKNKLIELGYEVTEETVFRDLLYKPKTKEIEVTKSFLGIFSYKTKKKIADGYEQVECDRTTISTCCGDE